MRYLLQTRLQINLSVVLGFVGFSRNFFSIRASGPVKTAISHLSIHPQTLTIATILPYYPPGC
jgi:hypothetical protein